MELIGLLSLATILCFEIDNIGVQARISSAVTLPPCSTCLPEVRGSPSHLSRPTKSASGEPGSSKQLVVLKRRHPKPKLGLLGKTSLGRRSPILVSLERVAPPRYARDSCPLASRWIPTVLDHAVPSQKPK
jgi:hypothetical protein